MGMCIAGVNGLTVWRVAYSMAYGLQLRSLAYGPQHGRWPTPGPMAYTMARQLWHELGLDPGRAEAVRGIDRPAQMARFGGPIGSLPDLGRGTGRPAVDGGRRSAVAALDLSAVVGLDLSAVDGRSNLGRA